MTKHLSRVGLVKPLALALVATAAVAAHAQSYPSRPVQIIVPFSAGGDSDQSARNLAATATGVLGQPVVVVNRAGANGAIGSQVVKDAAPDGHTLLLARIGSNVLLPALKPPGLSYKWNDFTFIGLLELNPVVCVVHPESNYKTFADLTKDLKARPGKLNYSTSGPATVPSLAPQLLLQNLDMKPDGAVAVNYKGGGDATLAVVSRDVDFTCNNLSSMTGQIAGGKLRALVTTTPERLKQFPDVPTARELGFQPMEAVVGWSALYGPPNMAPEAVKRWAEVLQKASTDPRWIAGNATYGGIPKILSPQETEKYIAENYKTYVDLIQKTGIELK
ncbi:tripartite tricarboxylate transporter substrate binding protein [Ramlibacter sp. AN1015]|uniref:Bug family tripartite tricarboxylate transporter substrate binding protein n=1 Tax=Ramlibacter sp. AN1015 TaxID=3133428 RepID=UPI0030BBADCF